MAFDLTGTLFKAWTDTGIPLVGGKVYTKASGTSIDKAVYTDASLTTPCTNPVILDARGEAQMWLGSGAYTIYVQDSTGVAVGSSVDGIVDGIDNLTTSLAGSSGSSLLGWIQSGTGAVATTVLQKLRDLEVNPLDFMTSGQRADALSGAKTLDLYAPIQAAFNASTRIRFPQGTAVDMKIGTQLTATIDHQIKGGGFATTRLSPSFSDFAINIPGPTTDRKVSLDVSGIHINGKYGLKVGGTKASHPTDFAAIGGRISISTLGTYGASVDPTSYNTDKVRDASNALVSGASGSNLSILNTATELISFGVGVQLCKCIDTLIDEPQFYGNGISVVLYGCDIVKWNGGRSHETGWHHYEERIGTWGSQTKITNVDTLHNRRAGGMGFNNTKFPRIYDGYFECYSDSAIEFWAYSTEGLLFRQNRLDDFWYTTSSRTSPFGIIQDPLWNNRITNNQYQKFGFAYGVPPIRCIGFAQQDSNHPDLFVLENNGPYFPLFDVIYPGYRYREINSATFSASNVVDLVGGNFAPLTVLTGNTYAVFNGSAIFPSVKVVFPDAVLISRTLTIRAKTVSGTTINFSIEHRRASGAFVSTVLSGNINGFNTATFTSVSTVLGLAQDPMPNDYFLVTWQANLCYLAAMTTT